VASSENEIKDRGQECHPAIRPFASPFFLDPSFSLRSLNKIPERIERMARSKAATAAGLFEVKNPKRVWGEATLPLRREDTSTRGDFSSVRVSFRLLAVVIERFCQTSVRVSSRRWRQSGRRPGSGSLQSLPTLLRDIRDFFFFFFSFLFSLSSFFFFSFSPPSPRKSRRFSRPARTRSFDPQSRSTFFRITGGFKDKFRMKPRRRPPEDFEFFLWNANAVSRFLSSPEGKNDKLATVRFSDNENS